MKLDVYDKIRQAHSLIKDIDTLSLNSWEQNAIDAVDSVLYLAEGAFASEHEK